MAVQTEFDRHTKSEIAVQTEEDLEKAAAVVTICLAKLTSSSTVSAISSPHHSVGTMTEVCHRLPAERLMVEMKNLGRSQVDTSVSDYSFSFWDTVGKYTEEAAPVLPPACVCPCSVDSGSSSPQNCRPGLTELEKQSIVHLGSLLFSGKCVYLLHWKRCCFCEGTRKLMLPWDVTKLPKPKRRLLLPVDVACRAIEVQTDFPRDSDCISTIYISVPTRTVGMQVNVTSPMENKIEVKNTTPLVTVVSFL